MKCIRVGPRLEISRCSGSVPQTLLKVAVSVIDAPTPIQIHLIRTERQSPIPTGPSHLTSAISDVTRGSSRLWYPFECGPVFPQARLALGVWYGGFDRTRAESKTVGRGRYAYLIKEEHQRYQQVGRL